ncbi:MAG: hypothetical protein DWQ30_22140 [Acidobacteria bacterium]|nr:MAG: hypothetical protein DWQ30_22140 [Acidobacteriota bacterium]
MGTTKRTSISLAPCLSANSGSWSRSPRLVFIQVKMIRRPVFALRSSRVWLNRSRTFISLAHLPPIRIAS